MPTMSRLRWWYLAYLSKPREYRELFRTVKKLRPQRILEIGLVDVNRSLTLLEVALDGRSADDVRYTAVDLFDARSPKEKALPLKQAHCLFKPKGIRCQFIPGLPHEALVRSANALQGTDLVIVSRDIEPESLAKSWFFMPRMLHAKSLVLIESSGPNGAITFAPHDLPAIERLASQSNRRKAA